MYIYICHLNLFKFTVIHGILIIVSRFFVDINNWEIEKEEEMIVKQEVFWDFTGMSNVEGAWQ